MDMADGPYGASWAHIYVGGGRQFLSVMQIEVRMKNDTSCKEKLKAENSLLMTQTSQEACDVVRFT